MEDIRIRYNKICDLVVIGNIANVGIKNIVDNKLEELSTNFSSYYMEVIKDNLEEDKLNLDKIYSLINLRFDKNKNIAISINKLLKDDVVRFVDKRNKDNKQIPNHEYIDREEHFAIFNINRGGILTTLHIISESMGCGLRYDMSNIPIRQETIEICDLYKINAYRLLTDEVCVFCVNNFLDFKHNLYDLIDIKYGKNKNVLNIKKFLDKYMCLIGELNNTNDKIRIDIETESCLEKSYQDEIEKVLLT